TMLEHFQGADGFYDTGDYHEKLITRPREIQDTATPSGNAMAVTVLLELGDLAMNQEYSNLATSLLQRMQPLMRQYPLGFSQWLSALVYAMSPTREIAIVGDPAHEQTRALLDVCRKGFRPHQVLAMSTPDGDGRSVPLSQNRPQVRGQATAYVCIESTCRPPVVDPIVLEALL
ncbi:MAG: thioredoxin domain-containing protein, partial [Chloroflexi bacterium]|nr:thioredoxin domain-containing protein [Chloroflexota bacterium]